MRQTAFVTVLLATVALGSTTLPAFEPLEVEVHPVLADLYASFTPAEVLTVTDGVYVARGFNRDNPVLIEGPEGLIVVDPGESIAAGEAVRSAFNDALDGVFDRKPVKAIVYTHHHDCHVHGAMAFAGPDTEVIGHANLEHTLFFDWYSQIYPSRLEGGAMMGGSLFADDPGWYAGSGLFALQVTGPSGHLPPTITVSDELRMTIGGVDLEIYSVVGETQDVLVVWIPDRRTMVQIANLYEAMPAVTTLRGASIRAPLQYIAAIDFYRTLQPEHLALIHGPRPVVNGRDEIERIFTNYRDGLQFIHDQTVQGMNRGMTPAEIAEGMQLPPHLASEPFLQETYGELYRNVAEIFWFYRGFFSGKCRDLYPQSPREAAEMAALLAGGTDQLLAKAELALSQGKPDWAMVLADDVLQLEPHHPHARQTKGAALLALAEGTMNAQARNYLLSEYLLDTRQAFLPIHGRPRLAFPTVDDHMVPLMPMDGALRIMAVNLNAGRSLEVDRVVGLHLSDVADPATAAAYGLHVRRGVLEVRAGAPEGAGLEATASSLAWKDLALGKLAPVDAVATGAVTLDGAEPEELYSFLALFDIPAADFAALPQQPMVGEAVAFDASASSLPGGELTLFEWDFGDGSHGLGVEASHAYAAPGTYTVRLLVGDGEQAYGSISRTVLVMPRHR